MKMFRVTLTYRDIGGRTNMRKYVVLAYHAADANNRVMEAVFDVVKGCASITLDAEQLPNVTEI